MYLLFLFVQTLALSLESHVSRRAIHCKRVIDFQFVFCLQIQTLAGYISSSSLGRQRVREFVNKPLTLVSNP